MAEKKPRSIDNNPTRRQMRAWVREFWADQIDMRERPDLPESLETEEFEEIWDDECGRIAHRIYPLAEKPAP